MFYKQQRERHVLKRVLPDAQQVKLTNEEDNRNMLSHQ
jgi:hypothetical protein